MKRIVLFIASLLLIGSLLPAIRGQSVQAQESNVMLPTRPASPQIKSPASPSIVHPPATTPRLMATTTQSWTLTATTPYEGDVGVGYVAYCPRLTESYKQRVVISIGGYGNKGGHSADWCNSFTDNDWQTEARRLGFDIYFINWADPKNYVQRNAFVVTKLIQDIQQTTGLGPEADFVVYGGSLGGLVGRYALAYMEANNQPHYADLFITEDSPLEGTYFPIGVQYMVNYFAEEWQIEQAQTKRKEELNHPLARQTLIYHYETAAGSGPTYTGDYEQLFITELQGQLGDYPHADGLRKVFVAAGRGDGQPDTPLPGSTIMNWRSNKVNIGDSITIRVPFSRLLCNRQTSVTVLARAALDVKAYALPNAGTGRVFRALPLFFLNDRRTDLLNEDKVVEAITTIVRDALPPGRCRLAWNAIADRFVRPNVKPLVEVARNFQADRYQEIRLSADHSYDGGPGGRDGSRIKEVETAVDNAKKGTFLGQIQYEFTFIPLHSALALDSPAPGVPIDPISVDLGSGSPPEGPFDEIHYPCKEQEAGYPCENEDHTGTLGNGVMKAELNRLVAAGAPPTDTTIYLPLIMN